MKKHILVLLLPVLSIIFSCGSKQTQTVSESGNNAIEKYLDEKMMNPEFGGKVFSSHEILKSTDDKIYLWAYLQEYYKKENVLQMGTGWSIPVVLSVTGTGSGMSVNSHQVPHDGMSYSEDIRSLFPEDIQQEVFNFSGTESISKLEKSSKERAEKFYQN